MMTKPLTTLALVGLLAACGSVEQNMQTSPELLSARIKEGVITGTYNPAGYEVRNVQAALRVACKDGRVSEFAQQPKDGLMIYSARCTSGGVGQGHYTFVRQGNQLSVEGTISDGNGNIIFVKKMAPAV